MSRIESRTPDSGSPFPSVVHELADSRQPTLAALAALMTIAGVMDDRYDAQGVRAFAYTDPEHPDAVSLAGAALSFTDHGKEAHCLGPVMRGVEPQIADSWRVLMGGRAKMALHEEPPKTKAVSELLDTTSGVLIRLPIGKRGVVYPFVLTRHESAEDGIAIYDPANVRRRAPKVDKTIACLAGGVAINRTLEVLAVGL